MASGFETRQSGRNSFASQGPAVKQIGRGTASGTHRDVQVVGGGAAAGGAPNAQIQEVGNITGQLGEFMAKAMQPYVERRQQEQFVEGLTRAQAGESIDELAKSRKGITGALFGPTSLAQGAQYYEAMRKVDQWDIDMNGRMDELKQLDPSQLAKEISGSWTGLLGDDPYINQMVSKQMIEKVGPRTDLVTKARYTWMQDTARKGMFDSLGASATSLQGIASQVSSYTDPTDDEAAALTSARENFLGRMQRPAGMSDDTYKATLTASLESFAQTGNFYAFNALKDAGVMAVLDDDGKEKVEKAYDRYKSVALDDRKGFYIEERLAIEAKSARGEMSALEKVAAYDGLNAKISRDTGITERAFDTTVLHQEGMEVIDMIASQSRREEERAYQAQVRKTERALDAADKAAEEQQKFSAALDGLRLGKPRSALASGIDAGSLRTAYFKTYENKDWVTLGRAFDQEHYFDTDVAKLAQSKMVTAGGITLTGEAQQGYEEWSGMMQTSPGMAAYVYGPQHGRMLLMQRLINGKVAPEQAYQRAFADLDRSKYPGTTLRPSDRRQTEEAITAIVDDKGSSWLGSFFHGVRPQKDQANRVVGKVIAETVAGYQRNSDASPEALTKQAYDAAIASGAVEVYGDNMAWRGDGRSKKANEVVGITPRAFGDLLYGAIDEQFKATGRDDGAETEYEINRTPTQGGGFILTVHPTDPANGIPLIISSSELKDRAKRGIGSELKQNQPKQFNGVNAYRRIPGETGLQRTARINREVKAGADPVNHNLSQ